MKKKSFGILLGFIVIVIGISLIFNKKSNSDKELSFYLDNEITEVIPKKGEALFSKAVCDNDTKASWNNENWSLEVINLSRKTKCNLYFGSYTGETVFNFDYTGAEQIFTAPVSGTYKLEIWGAQGGGAGDDTGGTGSYSNGKIYLKSSSQIYINIGGKGNISDDVIESLAVGGYNGGGSGINNVGVCGNFLTGSGGGATHIAKRSGLLNSLAEYNDDILIVAGGGGGGNFCNKQNHAHGVDAGGIIGNSAYNLGLDGIVNSYGLGGTQESYGCSSKDEDCGSFGERFSTNVYGVGAGGGYYGGGGSQLNGGGGGSGYIGNPLLTEKVMYCYNCKESDEESAKTISTTCNEETPTANCSKKGNGYARITLISIDT